MGVARVLLVVLLGLAGGPVGAQAPRIAIVIDDLGDRLAEGRAALDLPGRLTYAMLPHTPHAARLAREAHAAGKEVMLHQPMQAVVGQPLGPGGVTLDMSERRFRETVRANLRAVPHVAGLNNHMGSLLTQHPGHMTWLMALLREERVGYFLDSRTTAGTVAERMAREQDVATGRRHVFLDHDRDEAAIAREFRRLTEHARRQGQAIAIGHPYPETLAVLARELGDLERHGVELVTVGELLLAPDAPDSRNADTETTPWHASSSRSPTAARKSKPSP